MATAPWGFCGYATPPIYVYLSWLSPPLGRNSGNGREQSATPILSIHRLRLIFSGLVQYMFNLKGSGIVTGKWIDKNLLLHATFGLKDDGTFLDLLARVSNMAFTKKEKNKLRKLKKKIWNFLLSSLAIGLDDKLPNRKLNMKWKCDERTFLSIAKLKYRKRSKAAPLADNGTKSL